jgi:hypothetical protein
MVKVVREYEGACACLIPLSQSLRPVEAEEYLSCLDERSFETSCSLCVFNYGLHQHQGRHLIRQVLSDARVVH